MDIKQAKLCIFDGRLNTAIGATYRIKCLGYGVNQEEIRNSLYAKYDHISNLEIIDIKNIQELITVTELYAHFNNGTLPDLTNKEENSVTLGSDNFSYHIDNSGTIERFYVHLTPELHLHKQYKDKQFKISFNCGVRMTGYGFRSTRFTVEFINVSIEKTSAQIIRDIENRIFKKQEEQVQLVRSEIKELTKQENRTKVLEKELQSVAENYNGKYWYKNHGLKVENGQIYFDTRSNYFYFDSLQTTLKAIDILEQCNLELKNLK